MKRTAFILTILLFTLPRATNAADAPKPVGKPNIVYAHLAIREGHGEHRR